MAYVANVTDIARAKWHSAIVLMAHYTESSLAHKTNKQTPPTTKSHKAESPFAQQGPSEQ